MCLCVEALKRWSVEKPALSLPKGWVDFRPPMTDHRKIVEALKRWVDFWLPMTEHRNIVYLFICLMAMNNDTTWNVKPETWNLI